MRNLDTSTGKLAGTERRPNEKSAKGGIVNEDVREMFNDDLDLAAGSGCGSARLAALLQSASLYFNKQHLT